MSINQGVINSFAINGVADNNSVDLALSIRSEVVTITVDLNIFITTESTDPVNLSLAVQSIAQETPVNLTLAITTLVAEEVDLSQAIQNQVFVPVATGPNASANTLYWDFKILLGGVDVSAKVLGEIRVDREEGAAAIADFELLPFSGVIDIYTWIGQVVLIDFIERDSLGNTLGIYRRFTGIVNVPTYDPNAGTTKFNCTDNLQEKIESTPRTTLSEVLSGSRWSEHIFDDPEDNWSYHLQLASTIPASYDLDVLGNGQLTNWSNAAVDFTYTEDDIFYQSLDVELIVRREVLNSVNIELEQRTANRWQREISGTWGIGVPFLDWLQDPNTLPTKEMIADALDAQGWFLVDLFFTGLPPTGFYNQPPNVTGWILTDFAATLARGAQFKSNKRWVQTNTEKYILTVRADASIAKHGLVEVDDSYAITGNIETDWEDRTSDAAFINPIVVDSQFTLDRKFAVGEEQTVVDNAIETAIAVARNEILDSHRTNAISVELLFQPLVNLTHRVTVSTTKITGSGKVKRVIDILNVQSGDATTKFELAIYQPNTVGQSDSPIATPGSQYQTPTIPAGVVQMPPLETHLGRIIGVPPDDDNFRGYVGNKESVVLFGQNQIANGVNEYEERFVVEYPEVDSTLRDEVTSESSSTHNVAIPQDNLIIVG